MKTYILSPSSITLAPEPRGYFADDPLAAAFDLLADALLRTRCDEPTHYFLEEPGTMRLCATHLSALQGTAVKWAVDSQRKPCDFRITGARGQRSRVAMAVTLATRFLDHAERGRRVGMAQLAVEVCQ